MEICSFIEYYSFWIYIASISSQLAGALLLLSFVISTKRSKVIRRFLSNGFTFKDGNTNELSYEEDVFKDYFREAYLGKCSFLYITIGYLLGVFSSNNSKNYFYMLILISICTALLIFGALWIVKKIILCKKEINKKITNDELIELGLEAHLSSASNEEIDKLFVSDSDDTRK